jgi:hypothetical protein
MRDFNYAGARSQSIDEFICLCPIGCVKIRIPFIKQIDRIIGAIDDFLEHLQHSLPGRKTTFFAMIALRSVVILVFFLLVVAVTRVCTENLNPGVVMMKSAKYRVRTDDSSALNRARDRRIFIQ